MFLFSINIYAYAYGEVQNLVEVRYFGVVMMKKV